MRFRNVSSLLMVAVCISCSEVASGPDDLENPLTKQIESLYRKADWRGITSLVDSFEWKNKDDLDPLLLVTAAVVELRSNITEYFEPFKIPRDVREFLTVYQAMLGGNFRKSRQYFEAMALDQDKRELATLGLLEYATVVANPKLLEMAVQRARALHGSSYLQRRLPSYEATLASLRGDHKLLEKLLAKYRLEATEHAALRIQALLEQGTLKVARREIAAYIEKFGYDREIAPLESWLISQERDLPGYLTHLEDRIEQYPQYWLLKLERFHLLMKMRRTAEARILFVELFRERSSNPVVAADRLLFFGEELARTGKLELTLQEEADNFEDVPRYQLAKARLLYEHLNRKDEAKQLLDRVRDDAPGEADQLLLRAWFAKREGDAQEEIESLTTYLKMRPTDTEIMRALVDLHLSVGNRAQASKYELRLDAKSKESR